MVQSGGEPMEFRVDGDVLAVSPAGGVTADEADTGIIIISAFPRVELQEALGSLLDDHPGIEGVRIDHDVPGSAAAAVAEVAGEYGLGVDGA